MPLPFRHAIHTGRSLQVEQFLRRTTGFSQRNIEAYDDLINALVYDSLWPKIDIMYVLAAANEANAAQNLKSSSYTLTASGSPTFAADQGYTGNGSSMYLDTNFNPATAGGNFSLNSQSNFAYSRTDAATIASFFGTLNAAPTIYMSPRSTDLLYIGTSGGGYTTANTNAIGFYHSTRRGANDQEVYKNGASLTSNASGSTSLQSNNLAILRVGTGYSTGQCSFAGAGGGMTDAEASKLYERFNAFKTAIGF